MVSIQNIFHFKITILNDGKPSAYRIIALDKKTSLYNFAQVILKNFNFGFDHSFGFYDNTDDWLDSKDLYELFVDSDVEFTEGAQSVKINTIGTTFALRKNMLFLFDYGDEWKFLVEQLVKKESESGIHYPQLVESKGKAPKQ